MDNKLRLAISTRLPEDLPQTVQLGLSCAILSWRLPLLQTFAAVNLEAIATQYCLEVNWDPSQPFRSDMQPIHDSSAKIPVVECTLPS
mmetsp:Transcript_155/g.273  ORF Transcript_155/g.273 Transcript_155/m.273 type:complete len:88 (-) Transcript_155:658-921(-)